MKVKDKITDALQDLKTLVRFNLKIETRYPLSYIASVFSLLFWILSFSMLVLLFTGKGNTVMVNLLAYGAMVMVTYNTLVRSVSMEFFKLQKRGVLEQVLLSPVNEWILPLGLATYSLITAQLFMGVTLVSFVFFFNTSLLTANIIGGALSFALIFLMIYGFILFLAGVMIRLKRSANPLVSLLQFLFMILGGAFYSFQSVPWQMRLACRCFPFSYAVDLFRTSMIGMEPELLTEVTLFGYTLSPSVFEWLLVSSLTMFFLIGGYAFYYHTIQDGKKRAYLGTY